MQLIRDVDELLSNCKRITQSVRQLDGRGGFDAMTGRIDLQIVTLAGRQLFQFDRFRAAGNVQLAPRRRFRRAVSSQ